jgi:glycine oxidase
LTDGRHSDGFDAIVVASGFTRTLLVPELVELIPVAGQLVRVEGHHLDGALRKGLIYLIDRGDHTVIGATARPGDDRALVHPASTDWLLDEAAGVLPALSGLPVSDAWAGVRPGSQDGLPLIGQSSVPGVFVANGTYRNGWFLAPLVGQMISDALAGRPIDASFSPLRFLDW